MKEPLIRLSSAREVKFSEERPRNFHSSNFFSSSALSNSVNQSPLHDGPTVSKSAFTLRPSSKKSRSCVNFLLWPALRSSFALSVPQADPKLPCWRERTPSWPAPNFFPDFFSSTCTFYNSSSCLSFALSRTTSKMYSFNVKKMNSTLVSASRSLNSSIRGLATSTAPGDVTATSSTSSANRSIASTKRSRTFRLLTKHDSCKLRRKRFTPARYYSSVSARPPIVYSSLSSGSAVLKG